MSPSWDFPRATTGTRVMVQVGVEHGVPHVDLLAGTGLSAADLDDPDLEIEAARELAVARNLVAHLGDRPDLGVLVGSRYTLGNAGILGYAILSGPTVRTAITTGLRYIALCSLFVAARLEEGPGTTRVVFDGDEIPADVRVFLLQRDLAALSSLIPVIFGTPPGLRLELPDGAGAEPLAHGFGEVATGAPRLAIAFPSVLLDTALPQADEHTARMCERQCRDLLARRSRRQGFAERIRTRLHRPGPPPSMATVAAELHLDPRTLRRRLAAEGTSYRALLEEVRQVLALELLARVGLSVQETAHRLGYAETAAFTHAFKRWYGTPPSAVRTGSAAPPGPARAAAPAPAAVPGPRRGNGG